MRGLNQVWRALDQARTARDIASAALLSHGDTKQILLIPSSVEECYQMAMDAFDLAERFQQLVFVMSDLDLGMNMWMSRTFAYPDAALDRAYRRKDRTHAGGSAEGDRADESVRATDSSG